MKKWLLVFIISLQVCCFAAKAKLASVHVVDRHGISETITSKERLVQFEKTDCLSPQPYEKITRFYTRDRYGRILSILTSYHENGVCEQYLEVMNQRACGSYKKWHPNGQLALDCMVTGGSADLTPQAKSSWLFENDAYAYDLDGNLEAVFHYHKGMLEKEALYYHHNGQLWKKIPYAKDQIEGKMEVFLDDGTLLKKASYKKGIKHGETIRYWTPESIASKESYDEGRLMEASYFLPDQTSLCFIENGCGTRAIFDQTKPIKLEQYQNGILEGTTTLLYPNGRPSREFTLFNGEKEGLDTLYAPDGALKMQLQWSKGLLNGCVKTWYPNGTLESQREFVNNQKTGLSLAWYEEGSLMLVEEYDSDLLIKGEYYNPKDSTPVSRVEKGFGTATLFSEKGLVLQKIQYKMGKPE